MSRVYNFSAGPAMLPEPVLRKAAQEMCDYQNTGMSVMEMSHRSKAYIAVYESVEAKLRSVLSVPDTHKILFLQGGATLQFSAIPMNLLSVSGKADYAVTGYFSNSALKAARQYGEIRTAADTGDYTRIPRQDELSLSADAAYFHYCHNNTVYGTAWDYIPDTGDVPLCCDISSSILSAPMDVGRYGVLYAGAQKNMGPAGLTVVIVREDLLSRELLPGTPALLSYANQAKAQSMMNTPATYGIYLLGLVLDWVTEQGGLTAMEALNRKKSALVYEAVEASALFTCPAEPGSRSIMNVDFVSGDDATDARFIKEAAVQGLVTLKGHRAVGGMRASLYNAMPLEGAQALAQFIRDFK